MKTMNFTKPELRNLSCNGFKWIYFEKGLYYFQRELENRTYFLSAVRESDIKDNSYKYMLEHNLSRSMS